LRRLLVERSDDEIQRRQCASALKTHPIAKIWRDFVEPALILRPRQLKDNRARRFPDPALCRREKVLMTA
jgi:hypothetical protein